jgi:hypothetical integral membrane protein (TIGR02206 family)
MTVAVSPRAYLASVVIAAVAGVVLCVTARRRPGPWLVPAAGMLGAVLIGEQVAWQVGFVLHHNWSVQGSLPLDLCDFTCLVAAVACWWRIPVCVELTWFWAFAGTLQAIITPDVETPFPHLGFVDYVVEHEAIMVAAAFLVIGLRLTPRPGAVARIFGLTLTYAAAVAVVDLASGSDYLFLRAPPVAFSLLQVLGPWPWYIVSSAAIALVVFVLLDLPFRSGRAGRGGDRIPT